MSPPLSHHALASPIPTSRSLVLSSAALESNFVVQSTRGQFGWTNPSTEACELVAIELLTTIGIIVFYSPRISQHILFSIV
jgi:hypothetical protein